MVLFPKKYIAVSLVQESEKVENHWVKIQFLTILIAISTATGYTRIAGL
jgi:general stress protein CsbA